MERLKRSLLRRPADLTRALVDERAVGKPPTSAALLLQYAPKAGDGMEMGAPRGGEAGPAQRLLPGGERRRALGRPMAATAVDDPEHCCAGGAKEGHPWREGWAQPRRLTLGAPRREALRGPILARADDAEPHATGHTPPGALASPGLTCAGLRASALTRAQRSSGQAHARRLAPPAGAGAGQAPYDRFIRREEEARAPASVGRERRQRDRGVGQGRRGGRKPTGGREQLPAFFFTPRGPLHAPAGRLLAEPGPGRVRDHSRGQSGPPAAAGRDPRGGCGAVPGRPSLDAVSRHGGAPAPPGARAGHGAAPMGAGPHAPRGRGGRRRRRVALRPPPGPLGPGESPAPPWSACAWWGRSFMQGRESDC
jgi:hypothetical protein